MIQTTVQTTIDLVRLRELAPDPAIATDEQIVAATSLVPGTRLCFGQPSPELTDLGYADVLHIGALFDQAARRGLKIRSITPEV